MEVELHQVTYEDIAGSPPINYDTKLYESSMRTEAGQPFYKIVAETANNVEVVTGVAMYNSERDKRLLADWIRIARDLAYESRAWREITSMRRLGRAFEQEGGEGTTLHNNRVVFSGKSGRWSLQITAQGAPRPHLEMMHKACDEGTLPVTPRACTTDWQKLIYNIQVHMCNSVIKYLMKDSIKETKEALCFLPKATNIKEILKQGDTDFVEWCAESVPDLDVRGLVRPNGPHTTDPRGFPIRGKSDYEMTVDDLLNWANGQTKTVTLKEDSNFPEISLHNPAGSPVRIEYRQTKHFLPLVQSHAPATRERKSLAVINAIFRGCLTPKGGIPDTIETDCPSP